MRTLRDAVGVPLIVVSRLDDNLAAINGVLREAGHAVHCTRVDEPAALEEAVAEQQPELVLIFADEPDLDLTGLSGAIFRRNPPIPVVIVRQQVTERGIAEAIAAGARDVVSLAFRGRLQADRLAAGRVGQRGRWCDSRPVTADAPSARLHRLLGPLRAC